MNSVISSLSLLEMNSVISSLSLLEMNSVIIKIVVIGNYFSNNKDCLYRK